MKVKLLVRCLSWNAGEIVEVTDVHAQSLVSSGAAEWVVEAVVKTEDSPPRDKMLKREGIKTK